MKNWKGISIALSCSILLLAIMAQVPVTEQHVTDASVYSFMFGTVGTTYDLTMGKKGTSETWTAKINFWNDGSFLYVKFDCPDNTVNDGDFLLLCFDQEDVRYPYDLMHDGYLSAGEYGSWEDAHRLGRGPGWDGDMYWEGSDFNWDTGVPGHTNDFYDSWSTAGGRTIVDGTIPLNGRDTLDLNVRSGAVLGLYIFYRDAGQPPHADYVWPAGSAPYEDFRTGPATEWGDLWTMKVYTAVVPHAADEPGAWIGYLGLINNGLKDATVSFLFYSSAGLLEFSGCWFTDNTCAHPLIARTPYRQRWYFTRTRTNTNCWAFIASNDDS